MKNPDRKHVGECAPSSTRSTRDCVSSYVTQVTRIDLFVAWPAADDESGLFKRSGPCYVVFASSTVHRLTKDHSSRGSGLLLRRKSDLLSPVSLKPQVVRDFVRKLSRTRRSGRDQFDPRPRGSVLGENLDVDLEVGTACRGEGYVWNFW